MKDIIRKSIGALMLLIAVYLGYQDIFLSEDISGIYFGLTVFGCGGYYLIYYKPKPDESE